MAIARAGFADAERVLDFYSSTIDGMRNHPYRPRWIRDACPSCEGIVRHCINGEQYLLEGQGVTAAIVIRHAQEGSDGSVKWQVDAKGDEVSTIHLLAVRPELQNRGLATHLLGFAERLCRGRGDLAIRLAALPDSVPSNRLYARCGYQLMCTKSYCFDIAGNIEFHLYERPLAEQQSRIPDRWRTLTYHTMASARGWN